jgi:hypothetical protein
VSCRILSDRALGDPQRQPHVEHVNERRDALRLYAWLYAWISVLMTEREL